MLVISYSLDPEEELAEIEVTILKSLVLLGRIHSEAMWNQILGAYFGIDSIVVFDHKSNHFCFTALIPNQKSVQQARNSAEKIKGILENTYCAQCDVRQKNRFTVVT